ncbi:hypothetical protein TNIN_428971, partial [Trichonephila inaurata madagascariensis]
EEQHPPMTAGTPGTGGSTATGGTTNTGGATSSANTESTGTGTTSSGGTTTSDHRHHYNILRVYWNGSTATTSSGTIPKMFRKFFISLAFKDCIKSDN